MSWQKPVICQPLSLTDPVSFPGHKAWTQKQREKQNHDFPFESTHPPGRLLPAARVQACLPVSVEDRI